jgi:glycosyltransferase involved in cell wall biosynthesis
MSVGRPVVATNVGSIGETVKQGITGLLVQPGNAAAFAQQVVQLLREPLRCQAMGAEARRHVVRSWSLDAMVHGYENLLEELFARKNGMVGTNAAAACAPKNSAFGGE